MTDESIPSGSEPSSSTPATRPTFLRQWAGPLVVLAVTLAFFSPLISGDMQLSFRDGWRMSLPERSFLSTEIAAGRWPLWLPYEATGVPFLAQLSPGIFHPLNLLYALFPLPLAFAWNGLGAFALASLGAYVLARARGVQQDGACAAGLLFGLGGAIASQSNLQYLVAGASLPWALAGLALDVKHMTARSAALAATALTVLIFAGDPQMVIVAGLFGLIEVATRPAHDRRASLGRILLWACIGSGLAAVQLIPAFASFAASTRVDAPSLDLDHWNFSFARVLELLVPGSISDELAVIFGTARGSTWLPTIFMGPTSVLLAISWARRSRASAGLACGAILCLWLALPPGTGLTDIAHRLPVWRGFQYGEKLLVPFSLGLALLAAQGLERVRSGAHDPWLRPMAVALIGLDVILDVLPHLLLPGARADAARALRAEALVPLLGSGALMLLLDAARAAKRSPRLIAAGWLLLTVGPLVANLAVPLYGASAEALSPPWAAQVVLADHRGKAPPRVLSRDALQVVVDAGQRVLRRADPRELLATDYNMLWGIENFGHYHPARSVAFDDIYSDDARLDKVIPLFAVQYVVGPIGLKLPSPWLQLAHDPATNMAVYRATRARERAFVPSQVQSVPGLRAAILAVKAEGFLEHDLAVTECAAQPGDAERLDRGDVEMTRWSPDAVLIQAHMRWPGMVVLNDAFAEGWTAQVDEEAQPICRVNALVRGVRLPRGDHQLAFRYSPWSFTVGGWVSALSAAGMLAWIILERRRRASSAHGGPREVDAR